MTGKDLSKDVQQWATPRAQNATGPDHCPNKQGSPSLQTQVVPENPEDREAMKGGRLNPRWVEVLLGLPVGWTMPSCANPVNPMASSLDPDAYAALCVSCDNRTDELRLLGNGCVPATVTLAFTTLLQRFFNQETQPT